MTKSKSTNKIVSCPEPMYTGASGAMSKEDKKRMQQYQAEDDLRILTRANELREDKARLAWARALAQEQAKSLAKIK